MAFHHVKAILSLTEHHADQVLIAWLPKALLVVYNVHRQRLVPLENGLSITYLAWRVNLVPRPSSRLEHYRKHPMLYQASQ